MEDTINQELPLKLSKKILLLLLLLFLSFIPIWINGVIPLVDVILIIAFSSYFFKPSKIKLKNITTPLFIVSVFSFLSFFGVLILCNHSYLRIKTALAGMLMIMFFAYFIKKIASIYQNTNFLVLLSKYFYYFSLIDLFYLALCILINGSDRGTRITPLIGDLVPFKESALYIYGYVLSKWIITERWKKGHLFLLFLSSLTNFFMFYRSLLIVWLVITLFMFFALIPNKRKYIYLGFSTILGILISTFFITEIKGQIVPLIEFTQIEMQNIAQITGTNLSSNLGMTRLIIWQTAFNHIHDHPLTGNGVGFEDYLGATGVISQEYGNASHDVATFHNQILGFWVDYGLVILLLLYFTFINIYLLGFKTLKTGIVDPVEKHAVFCFFTIFIIYFIGSFVGGRMIPSHTSFITVLPLWLFIAAMMSEHQKRKNPLKENP